MEVFSNIFTFFTTLTATSAMQYFIGFLMASLPAVIWAYIFYRKSPEKKRTLLLSFLAGILSVIPIFVWQSYLSVSINLFGIKIPNLNIYSFVKTVANNPNLQNIMSFIGIAIIISLIIYLSAAFILFISNMLITATTFLIRIVKIYTSDDKEERSKEMDETKARAMEEIILATKNILKRSIEEPLIFISTGVLLGLFILLTSRLLSLFVSLEGMEHYYHATFWYSIMIGYLEEFSKHLLVRFSDDETIYSIDSAIEFSVIVALGFAFLENILYFVQNIWLSSCSVEEISKNLCLLDPATGIYMHQVGVLLIPYIFRSILSTLAHLVFSGIFGYYYGVAHFASYELQELEKKKGGALIWGTLHKLFRLKTSFVFHEMKIFQGLLIAMFFHGIFDFFMELNLPFVTVPMIGLGFIYIYYLMDQKESHKKLRLIVDTRTSSTKEYKEAVDKIELLRKFEEDYLAKTKGAEEKTSRADIQKNILMLEKYEALERKQKEMEEKGKPLSEVQKNLLLLQKYEESVKKREGEKKENTTP